MAKLYSSAFLIPASSKKIFEEVGWSFETDDRLCVDVLENLKHYFLLEKKEEYSGIVVYVGSGLKISVVYDENKLIEHIAVQLNAVSAESLKNVLDDVRFDNVEIFFPSAEVAVCRK